MNTSHSLPGPDDITRIVLPNNITILVRSNFNSPSVTLSGYLATGSLFDPDTKLGLADFATSALMRGTQTGSFEQIYDSLESVGAHLGFSAGTHTSGFSGRALVEDLPLLFDLISNCLRQPIFPEDELERLRTQMLTGLAMRAQDTGSMASMTFDKLVFGAHPYARPDDGYPETIRAITRADMVDYHSRCFGPNGLTIAVVGAVNPDFVVAEISRTLGDWLNPQQPALPALPTVSPLSAPLREHIPLAGKSQTDLMVGVLGPLRRDPEYLAASLGNSVLGQFGMMGRIGDVVREQSGLAYYASSSLSAGTGPGTWEVSAGVNPSNLEKALDLIIAELRLFIEKGVSSDELQDCQDNFAGRLPLSLESNAGVASALINIERHQLGLDYYRRYEDLVRAVTPEMVLEAARKYINPNLLVTASSGP
ncbi:MAG: pitrilysin family protein [Chloroflexi bacterium]|nr:pitrilysin family protein [Chloroflexota bacterium]